MVTFSVYLGRRFLTLGPGLFKRSLRGFLIKREILILTVWPLRGFILTLYKVVQSPGSPTVQTVYHKWWKYVLERAFVETDSYFMEGVLLAFSRMWEKNGSPWLGETVQSEALSGPLWSLPLVRKKNIKLISWEQNSERKTNKYSHRVLIDSPHMQRVSMQGGSRRMGNSRTAAGRAAGAAGSPPGCTVSGRPVLKLSPPPF